VIKPLQLGNKIFPSNIIQGPLAGISCAPFRRLIWQYSQPAFACTEMISCKTLLNQPLALQQRFVKKDPAEGPVCFQLSANNPEELADATKKVTDYGADLIDLNCGCPVRKIRSKGAGSKLLTDSAALFKLIRAMKENTHVPVSIKIRVQGDSNEKFNHEIAKMVADSGVDYLIVHGRHWTERYDVACRHDEIEFFVNELKIPVIGNGDIADAASLKKMFATGCAGVMIGRAGVGQPWLIAKIIAEMQAEKYAIPALKEIGAVFIDHVEQLGELIRSEKFAVLQARKVAKYYARDVANRIDFCVAINGCKTIADLKAVALRYFI